jgi:hypothetical protein
LYSLSL